MAPIIIIFLLLSLSWIPATAQNAVTNYVPDVPEEPMISLTPEELPEADEVLSEEDMK